MSVAIRLAAADDLPHINDIYNFYVANSTTTYDSEPMSLADRHKWFEGRDPIHPVTVAYSTDPESTFAPHSPLPPASGLQSPASFSPPPILGWGSLHPFRAKSGYRFTVENSVYVHPDYARRGVGSAILLDQIARARALGLHAIVAGVDAEQTASLALHTKHGFVEVGRFPQIGRKFNRWLDVVFLELVLE